MKIFKVVLCNHFDRLLLVFIQAYGLGLGLLVGLIKCLITLIIMLISANYLINSHFCFLISNVEQSEQYKGTERRIDFMYSSQRTGFWTSRLVSNGRVDERFDRWKHLA